MMRTRRGSSKPQQLQSFRHFAPGAAFARKFATAEGLSKRELGEVAETFVAWKAADKALADYHAESAGAKATKDR
jgi:hypothetical protein